MRDPNQEREIQAAFDGYIKREEERSARVRDAVIETVNRALAKADLEAERAGNLENDLDAARATLRTIADIAEGSCKVSCLSHIAKLAREAL